MEVLVAMTIFAVGIVGVISGFSQALRVSSGAGKLDRAAALARRELTEAIAEYSGNAGAAEGACGQFKWRISVADRSAGLVLASIQVTWRQRGDEQTFTLSQLFAPEDRQGQP